MQRRAEQVDETRHRIVEATVRLHGTLGPARTTIARIADEAGVTRLTIYRHFPDDGALFAACSAHWASQQTRPDPGRWREVLDAEERLRVGLTDLYRFYRDGATMLALVHRDLDAMPEAIRRGLDEANSSYRKVLLAPFKVQGRERRRVRGMIGHAIIFATWQSLCVEQRLSNPDAVSVMTSSVVTQNQRER